MTKLCPRGKAAAKRKFKVYPSAYANAYASRICAGKIKDPSGVKRKDFKGRKPAMGGGMMNRTKFDKGGGTGTGLNRPFTSLPLLVKKQQGRKGFKKPVGSFKKIKDIQQPIEPSSRPVKSDAFILAKRKRNFPGGKKAAEKMKEPMSPTQRRNEDAAMKRESRLSTKIIGYNERVKQAGGGLMEATARLQRQGLRGGGICKKGMNRKAVGKNS